LPIGSKERGRNQRKGAQGGITHGGQRSPSLKFRGQNFRISIICAGRQEQQLLLSVFIDQTPEHQQRRCGRDSSPAGGL